MMIPELEKRMTSMLIADTDDQRMRELWLIGDVRCGLVRSLRCCRKKGIAILMSACVTRL
jgi:hypothetical protein